MGLVDLIKEITTWINDRSTSLVRKLGVFTFIFIGFLIYDSFVGFTFHYNKQRQLIEIQSIRSILADSSLTVESRRKLLQMEQEILDKQNLFSRVDKAISDNSGKSEGSKTVRRFFFTTEFWNYITSGGFFWILLIFTVYSFFVAKNPFWESFAAILLSSLVFIVFSIFHYWLIDKILPDKVFGSQFLRYVSNVVLQAILLSLYVYSDSMANKDANEEKKRMRDF